jgi:ankyrin repeat protein
MPQNRRPIFTRTLPTKPNLNQLKKQAKDLLRAFQADEATAVAEVRARHPEPIESLRSQGLRLNDAQLVLARSYGFDSWPKLKAFVDGFTMTRFVAAVQAGDIECVRAMLRQRPELVHMDTAGNNEHRGLHYAVLSRDAAMVRLLMQAGADSRKGIYPHRDATTALALARDRDYQDIVAVIEGEEQRRREQMSCPNSAVSPAQDQINDAIRQGDSEGAIRLIEADPFLIRACDRTGGTALHAAAQATNLEMVNWLLARGAGVNKHDLEGLTPIDRSALAASPYNDCAERFPAVAKLLLQHGAEITVHAAVALDDRPRIRKLVGANRSLLREIHWSRGGLLSLAVKHGQLEAARLLLDLGVDVDERTLLHELEEPTASWGTPLWYAAILGHRDIAELLLDRGADPNANVYASGWPLRNAYQRRDETMKRLLLERGARPQPYMVSETHDVAEARRLLEADPSEELAQELAWSAADSGCPAIVELALQRLRWGAQDPRWNWILIQPIRGLGNDTGLTPNITTEDRLQCLELVLRHEVDPDVGRLGQTALHFTAAWQRVPREEDRIRFAALLLDAGARLDLRDDLLKSTPLGWACRWGREDLAGLLIARGASVDEPNAEPWATPLAWARKMGHSAIERRLRERGAER